MIDATLEFMSEGNNHRCFRMAGGKVLKLTKNDFALDRLASHARALKMAEAVALPTPRLHEWGYRGGVGYIVEEDLTPAAPLSPTDFAQPKICRRVAEILVRLHAIDLKLLPAEVVPESSSADNLSWKARLHRRFELTLRSLPAPSRTRDLRDRFRELLEAVSDEVPIRLTHFDCKADNFLSSRSGQLWLIDFDSARNYDPLWDLVHLERRVFADQRSFGRFLETYSRCLQSRGRESELKDIEARLAMYRFLDDLRERPYG